MRTKPLQANIQFSPHCYSRLSQRGIKEEAVLMVIQYGEIIHKQGLKFYFIPKAKCKKLDIPDEQVKDLMVITNSNTTEVVTCYKNCKAVHQVKKKSKRLSKKPKYRQHNLLILSHSIYRQVA